MATIEWVSEHRLPFLFRLAHEPSPDYSSKKNPNSPYSTNLNPKYANRARFLITWQTSTSDPTGQNPHSVPNSNPGPKSRPKRALYIFYTTFSSPIFFYSLLLLHLLIFYIFFLSTTTTTFYCFPPPPTPLPHLCRFHSPYCFPARQAKKANLRPK